MCVHACSVVSNSLPPCGLYSPPGSSVHGIFRARMLEWVAISSSRGFSQHRDRTGVSCISCIGRQILYHRATWEAQTCMVVTNNGTGIRLIIFETYPCPQASLGLSFLIYKMGIREVYIRHLQDYRKLSMNCGIQ